MPPKTIEFERKSLRQWIDLEEARSKIRDDFKAKNAEQSSQNIFAYIQLATKDRKKLEWDKFDGISALALFLEARLINTPTREFPILKFHNEQKETPPWEYPGRAWYYWLNLFSKNYHWPIDYISKLDIDDAIGLYQECKIDEQIDKEWEWGLSEIAYPYDPSAKAGIFKPLGRPQWMLGIAPKPRVVHIKADMLPMGNIEGIDELNQAVESKGNP